MSLITRLAAQAAQGAVSREINAVRSSIEGRIGSVVGAAKNDAQRMVQQAVEQQLARLHPLARQILGPYLSKTARFVNGNGFVSGLADPTLSASTKTPLLGGLSPDEAIRQFRRFADTPKQKANLWFIQITDFQPAAQGAANSPYVDVNMLALAVDYAAVTVNHNPQQVGSRAFSKPAHAELQDIRVTTLDDAAGSIKTWFAGKANSMARPDGTYGLPADYLMKLRVMHAFIGPDQADGQAFVDEFIVQPKNIEISLNRRDDALAELQLTFGQFDNFGNIQ